jgi:hypothetical protein
MGMALHQLMKILSSDAQQLTIAQGLDIGAARGCLDHPHFANHFPSANFAQHSSFITWQKRTQATTQHQVNGVRGIALAQQDLSRLKADDLHAPLQFMQRIRRFNAQKLFESGVDSGINFTVLRFNVHGNRSIKWIKKKPGLVGAGAATRCGENKNCLIAHGSKTAFARPQDQSPASPGPVASQRPKDATPAARIA